MIPVTAASGVDCPRCGGTSTIDAEHRHFLVWACPFCGASNPMPSFPDVTPPVEINPARIGRRAMRSLWIPAAAAAVAAAVIVAAIAGQARMPRGDYRTIEGLTAALADHDLACLDLTRDPAPPPGVRAAASCSIGSVPVWLVTFGSPERRDAYLAMSSPSSAAVGGTWIVSTSDDTLARSIARTLGARFVARGT